MNTAEFIVALFDADPSGEAEVVLPPQLCGLPMSDWLLPSPGMVMYEGERCARVALALPSGEAIAAGLASLKAERDALAAQLEGKLGIAPNDTVKGSANVAAFVLKAPAVDRLLLVRSGKPGRAWELPGGAVEPGESRSGAAKRECWEETGVRLVRVAHYCSVEGCEVFRGASETDPLTAGDDAIEAHWFDRADIACLSLSDLPTAAVIRQWVERR